MKTLSFACLRTLSSVSRGLAACLALVASAKGSTHVWIGPVNGLWSNPACWSGGIPTTGESGGTLVVFGTSGVSICNYPVTVDQIAFNGGGNVIVNGGSTLSVSGTAATENIWSMAGDNAITAPIQYVGTSTIYVRADGGTLTLAGALSGTTANRKRGNGTLTLSAAANTNTGQTSVSEGILLLDSSGVNTCILGDLVVADGGGTAASVVLDQSLEIKDTSNITVNAGGVFDLKSFNDGFGNLTVSGGSVTFTTASVNVGGVLSMTGGSISGTTGSLTLQGDVTATSSATATATISSLIALPATRTFTVNDGAQATDLTLSNVISGAGAGFIKNGTGTLLLSTSTNNTYGGTTTVNQGTVTLNGGASVVIPGALVIGSGSGAAGSAVVRLGQGSEINNASNVTVKSDGLFDLASFSDVVAAVDIDRGSITSSSGFLTAGPLTMNGGSIISSSTGGLGLTGDVTATSTATSTATVQGNVILGGTRTFTVNAGGMLPNFRMNGVVSGSPAASGLTKAGTGTMMLMGASGNTFTGTTTVTQGTLQLLQTGGYTINGPLVIGNAVDPAGSAVVQEQIQNDLLSSISVTINKSGVLDMNGYVDTIDALSGEGSVLLTGSQLTVGSANSTSTFSGTIVGGGTGKFAKAGSGTLTLSGKLTSGLDTVTVNDGTLVQKFGAGSATVAKVQVGDGVGAAGSAILDLSAADQLAPLSLIDVKLDGVLKTNGFNTGASTVTIDRGVINVPGATFTTGNITMTGGSITGAGSMVLNGDIVASSAATGGASIAPAIALSGTRQMTVNSGGAVPNLLLSGVLSSAPSTQGGITKKGPGTMQMAGGNNTYFGTTTVDQGVLEMNKNVVLAVPGPLVIGNDVDPAGSAVVRCLINFGVGGGAPVTVKASGKFDLSGFTERAASISGTGAITGTASNLTLFTGDATYDGLISGGTAVTKSGTGTQIFTKNNTYTGGTYINAGKLCINGTQSGIVNVGAAGTVGGIGTSGNLDASVAGARVAPGAGTGTSPGILHVTGNANLSNGTLLVRLNDATAQKIDQLKVTGDLNLTGATLQTTLLGQVVPTTQVIASFGGTLTGTFANLPPGYTINYAYNDGLSTKNIAITVTNPWQAWLAGYGLNPATTGLPDADPDKDGISNGIEFVLGSDPTVPSGFANLPSGSISGANYVFVFRRVAAAASYNPVVQISTTLGGASWTDLVSGVSVEPNFYGPGIDRIVATISRTGKPRLYCRMKIDGL
ncbi:beta strand repeat-containing protein [Luteolibacter soli]|uniref:Autotransporter-associated beta strand repeat-containing protein n=1 Tax=Luteolibacter soli TaxID=3135280 RepID=A0ABU9B253_9BACT